MPALAPCRGDEDPTPFVRATAHSQEGRRGCSRSPVSQDAGAAACWGGGGGGGVAGGSSVVIVITPPPPPPCSPRSFSGGTKGGGPRGGKGKHGTPHNTKTRLFPLSL
jgi:hypothetical protein